MTTKFIVMRFQTTIGYISPLTGKEMLVELKNGYIPVYNTKEEADIAANGKYQVLPVKLTDNETPEETA